MKKGEKKEKLMAQARAESPKFFQLKKTFQIVERTGLCKYFTLVKLVSPSALKVP